MVWVVWALLAAGGSEGRISVEVEWDAPETCPPAARFEAELRARSSRVRIVQAPEPAEAHLSMKVVEQKKRFTGVSKLHTTLSGVTTRQFKSAQCETLVQAAALATSLLLDPEGTRLGAVTLSQPPPVEPEAPVVAPDAGIVVVTPEPVDAGPTDPTPPDAGTPVAVPPPPAAASPIKVEVFVGAAVTSAVSGALDPLVQATVGFAFGRLHLELAPQYVFGRRVSAASGVAQYLGAGGRVAGSAAFALTDWLRFEVGAHLTLLAVPVSAPSAEVPGSQVGVLVAPGALSRFVLSFGRVRVGLEGLVGIHTRRESYVITGSGAVFTAPLIFGTGVVAVGWAL